MAGINLDKIAMALVVIGSVNVGLGIFNINVVDMVANMIPIAMAKTIIIGAIGVSGLLLAKKLYMK